MIGNFNFGLYIFTIAGDYSGENDITMVKNEVYGMQVSEQQQRPVEVDKENNCGNYENVSKNDVYDDIK